MRLQALKLGSKRQLKNDASDKSAWGWLLFGEVLSVPTTYWVRVHACKEDFKPGLLLVEFWNLIKNPDVPLPSKGDQGHGFLLEFYITYFNTEAVDWDCVLRFLQSKRSTRSTRGQKKWRNRQSRVIHNRTAILGAANLSTLFRPFHKFLD